MLYVAILRFIRRRIVLGLILVLSFTYCIVNLLRESHLSDNDVNPSKRTQPFIWRTLQEHNESSDGVNSCRNSIQGRLLIVDDRGYVCPRQYLLSNGCCNIEMSNSSQYSCASCDIKHCCEVYEYCISCCLHPDKRKLLETFLDKVSEHNNVLYAAVKDHFELCLTKCRTNSQSVKHENAYKNPRNKHCYGEAPPLETNEVT